MQQSATTLPTDISVESLVLDSTTKVVEKAKHVRVNRHKLAELAQELPTAPEHYPNWDHERQYSDGTTRTADWVFVLDTLNFSFWPENKNKRWSVTWKGTTQKGYWVLACGLKRAMQQKVPITEPKFLESIDEDQLAAVLGGEGTIPMLSERVMNLREVGKVLHTFYGGSFTNLLLEAGGCADTLIRKVVEAFPCFYDVARYKDENVYIFKRAQILVSDLWGAFNGKELGYFFDINSLTAFADYKLPQLLRCYGTLEYSTDLSSKVDSMQLLAPGSEEEIEIRASTIHAVECLRSMLKDRGIEQPSFMLDWWLWENSHENQYELKPHHRTRTIFY